MNGFTGERARVPEREKNHRKGGSVRVYYGIHGAPRGCDGFASSSAGQAECTARDSEGNPRGVFIFPILITTGHDGCHRLFYGKTRRYSAATGERWRILAGAGGTLMSLLLPFSLETSTYRSGTTVPRTRCIHRYIFTYLLFCSLGNALFFRALCALLFFPCTID